MISLNLVSFVGIDQATDFDSLKTFSNSKMKYEFGVLYSESKNGKDKRYPTHEFANKYLDWAHKNNVLTSLHLCGSSIDKYLDEDKEVIGLSSKAGRIQLNLNIKKYNDYRVLSDNIISVAEKNNHKIILQKNNTKKQFNEVFLENKSNIALSLLHDSSGGFGREISIVSPPDKKYYTGYAGGIKSSNVLNIVKLIEEVNKENISYYIDMESGIRQNNLFSIEECLKIKELIEAANSC
jgi:hypothetical protein